MLIRMVICMAKSLRQNAENSLVAADEMQSESWKALVELYKLFLR